MLEITEVLILTASVALITLIKLIDKKPSPIFGVYQRRNGLYWIKVTFMYLFLTLRKLKPLKKENIEKLYSNIEKPQKLSTHEKPIDAVYLNGANKHGDHLVVGLARRQELLVDGFLYLKLNSSECGLLETPKLPDTALYKEKNNEEYSAEGIRIVLVEPMKKWRVLYEGKMKRFGDRTQLHNVKIDGIWTSDSPCFNFDDDMDPFCMAKNHQTHYEQFGILKGTVTIDDVVYKIEMDTLRDHSFGIHREWRQFKRYCLHFFSAENGDRISVGKICLPISFSRLTVGYVYSSKDRKIFAIQDCDLELYQHGELGSPPKDYAFSFTAGGEKYTVNVNVVDVPYFYISKDWEAKIFEMLCTFEINGIKGWGAAEWQYRNIEGKQKCPVEKLEKI